MRQLITLNAASAAKAAAFEPITDHPRRIQLRGTTSNNRLHAPDFAVVQHHFDAVRVCGTFGEDADHDALRQCTGALVLLLHDLHAQPRANFTAYRHTHSFSVSCLYGVQSNQERLLKITAPDAQTSDAPRCHCPRRSMLRPDQNRYL